MARRTKIVATLGRASRDPETLARMVSDAETAGDMDKVARLKLKRAQLLQESSGDQAEAVRETVAWHERAWHEHRGERPELEELEARWHARLGELYGE